MKKGIFRTILALVSLCCLSSCIYEDGTQCGLYLHFKYDYNIKDADAFEAEVDEVLLYIFDSEGTPVMSRTALRKELQDGTMKVSGLEEGEYRFVVWARGSEQTESHASFYICSDPGSPEDLSANLPVQSGAYGEKIERLYNASLVASVSGLRQDLDISLMKCTNTLRVILMPLESDLEIEPFDYSLSISGLCPSFGHDASPEGEIGFVPCIQYVDAAENNTGETSASPYSTKAVDRALVAEFSLTRLMADTESELDIDYNGNGSRVLSLDLSWFLSLQGIGEHRSDWSNQEYLDRQDYYNITFFVSGSTWMESRIVVNGWVLSLADADLK